MLWSGPRRFLPNRDPKLLALRGLCGSFHQSARSESAISVSFRGHPLSPTLLLANLCRRILIPIVLATMANEHTALRLDLLDQLASLQASSSSACCRTLGIFPVDRSL